MRTWLLWHSVEDYCYETPIRLQNWMENSRVMSNFLNYYEKIIRASIPVDSALMLTEEQMMVVQSLCDLYIVHVLVHDQFHYFSFLFSFYAFFAFFVFCSVMKTTWSATVFKWEYGRIGTKDKQIFWFKKRQEWLDISGQPQNIKLLTKLWQITLLQNCQH